RIFWSLAFLIGLGSLGVWIRFTVAYAEGNGKGHVQSLILGAVLFIAAVVLWALGVIGDVLAAQRVMTQKTFERVRRIELELEELVDRADPASLLDVGCGEGVLAQRLARRLPSRRVVGVDLQEDSIQAGWSEHAAPNLSYRTLDGGELPFAPGEFDMVSAIEV